MVLARLRRSAGAARRSAGGQRCTAHAGVGALSTPARTPYGLRAVCAGLSLSLGLGACSTQMQSGLDTAQAALGWSRSAAAALDASPLDPALSYLRVQVQGKPGLVVLGDQTPGPLGLTSVWYSADGAVLRLVEGRLVGFADRQKSWAVTALRRAGPIALPSTPGSVLPNADMPDWHAVARLTKPQIFEQLTDVQPGYRLGLTQQRERLAQAAAPAGHQARGLPAHAQWFVERDSGTAAHPAWFAYDLQQRPARWLYGQACLDAQHCLSWQPWPLRAAVQP